jgi:hypothetical protein
MKFAVTISFALLFAACNPGKRIMKDVEQFDKLGNEWAIRNPSTPKVETISKRDTLFRVDSVKNTYYVQSSAPGGSDTVYHETVINNRFYYHDSTTNTVTDTRQVDAYKKLLNDCQVLAAKNEARFETVQKQFVIAIVVAALMFLALIVSLIILIKK